MLSKDKIPRCKYYGGTSSRTILHRQSHSIPRLGCYGKHHNTYILLPFCILALLVVGWSMISPSTINVSNVVNAMEGDGVYVEEGSVGSVESSGVDVEDGSTTYTTNTNEKKEGSDDGDSRDEDSSSPSSPSLSSSTSATYDVEDHDIGNSTDTPTSRAASPSAALTINNGGSINTSASTTVGETAYISNTVNVQASEIKSYVLQVSYASGSTGLKSSDGKVTIGGAGGKTGTSLSNNTWGYGWGDTSVANASLTYSTMPSAGTTANLSGNAISNNAINFTKKLVFAAKFGEDVSSGHYRASVMLSLAATPKEMSWDGITAMQQLTPTLCRQAAVGTTGTLLDSRDNKSYKVTKLPDQNCWMVENLRLGSTSSSTTLTPSNSNVNTNWTAPAVQSANSTTWSGDVLARETNNGNLYSWCYATAESCNDLIRNSTDLQTATASICPKNWTLPANTHYTNLISNISKTGAALSTALRSNPYNFVYTGYVSAGQTQQGATNGYYWTSVATHTYGVEKRAIDLDDFSYHLSLSSSYVNVLSSYPLTWKSGGAIRCIVANS